MSAAIRAVIQDMMKGWVIQPARNVPPRSPQASDITCLAAVIEARLRGAEPLDAPPPAELAGWTFKTGIGTPNLHLNAEVLAEIASILDGGAEEEVPSAAAVLEDATPPAGEALHEVDKTIILPQADDQRLNEESRGPSAVPPRAAPVPDAVMALIWQHMELGG